MRKKSKRHRVLVWLPVAALCVLFISSCDLSSSNFSSLIDGGFILAPEITENEIDLEITGIGSDLRGYDNFPSITLFVKPTDPETGELIPGLVRADFFDVIDDNGEARPIEVFPRGSATTANKQADIVFVIDTTGSMGSYLATMTSKAQDFADILSDSDLNFRLGFVSFGDEIRKGSGEQLAPTSDVEAFKTAVGALSAYGGGDGPENPIDTIDYARAPSEGSNPAGSFQVDQDFTYRDSAARIFILITDINYHTPAFPGDVTLHYPTGVWNSVTEEISKLNTSGVNVHVVAPSSYSADYTDLAEDTGGEFFDINTDFSAIIDTIGEEITTMGDYMITFMSNDFSESRTHTIRIAVHTRLGAAQATAAYVSPDTVDFERARRQLQEFEARFAQ